MYIAQSEWWITQSDWYVAKSDWQITQSLWYIALNDCIMLRVTGRLLKGTFLLLRVIG